jgi:hypothetical protein
MKRMMVFLIMASLSLLLMAQLFSNQLIPNDMDILWHVAAIIQAKWALISGQFPLRFAPPSQAMWSYPLFQFYSPTSYTIAGLIYQWFTPANPYIAYKITIWSFSVIGGIYMYRLAFWFIESQFAAILASIVYLFAPHHIVIIDHMGAFNEIIALGIVPCVLFYTLKQYSQPSINYFLLSGITWYLLITTHLITCICTAFLTIILLLIVTLKRFQSWNNLIATGMGMLFGCLLAIWYLAPLDLFGKYLIANNLFQDVNLFYSQSPTLKELLSLFPQITVGFRTQNGIISSLSRIHPAIGPAILFAVILCLYAIIKNKLTGKIRADKWLLPFLILFLVAFIIAWSPINFWQWLPDSFRVIQYSWRLLGQVMWIGALLFAWAIYWIFKNKLSYRKTFFCALLIVLSACPLLFTSEIKFEKFSDLTAELTNSDTLLGNGYLLDVMRYPEFTAIIDNIPIGPTLNTNKIFDVNKLTVFCHQQKEDTLCELIVPNTIRLLELPVYYYPKLLNVTVNNKPVIYIGMLYKNRAIVAVVPEAGKLNTIKIQFTGLKWANYLSSAAWQLVIFLFLFLFLRRFSTKPQ